MALSPGLSWALNKNNNKPAVNLMDSLSSVDDNQFEDVDCNIPKRGDYSKIPQLETLKEKENYIYNKIDWDLMVDSLSVKEKHSPASPFLDRDVAERFCLHYQRYLFLMCKYRDTAMFPSIVGSTKVL